MIKLKQDDATYSLKNLKIKDLEIIQEGLHRLFNESAKNEHHDFRTQVLEIDRAIDPALAKHFDNL